MFTLDTDIQEWNLSVRLLSLHLVGLCDNQKTKKRILSKEEWKALNELRNDNSIIGTRPDKGNGVVIANKLDYLITVDFR